MVPRETVSRQEGSKGTDRPKPRWGSLPPRNDRGFVISASACRAGCPGSVRMLVGVIIIMNEAPSIPL
jgi:hypothetical protein